MVPPLLVRADAGPDVGLGHLLRTLALAQAWQRRGGEVTYATAELPDALHARLEGEGVHVEPIPARHPDPRDADALGSILVARWGWVVVDGYHLDVPYRRRIREAGKRVLVIGDVSNQELGEADAVLNQNAGAELNPPAAEPGALLLLGSRYALVREEFLVAAAAAPCAKEEARRVLVTFGGGDDGGASATALRSLVRTGIPDLDVRVLVGPTNPNADALAALAGVLPFACRVVSGGADLPALFSWAELAVAASGSTCWELCALGVPIVAVRTADNQTVVECGLAAGGAAVVLGRIEDLSEDTLAAAIAGLLSDPAARDALSHAGRRLVDGGGADRVVDALLGAAA